ncbi:cupin domain-containing protein [Alkalihalobacillus sp. MEB203]|uniref:Cupin domain-containing protein n=2 Tax=Alkalihalobacterium chitinilyticum TaxID=2980103 RepID=A0ABT5VLL3_9BACI|nr:cupin domain-containing protein [Alkalihalobacterium chitinilyticum]
MYYMPQTYSYPYYPNGHMYQSSNGMQRGSQGPDYQAAEDVLAGIKREAAAIDLYMRLAEAAPNQKHRTDLLHSLESKKGQLNQLTHLYYSFTGREPVYQVETVPFQSYREGLQKAYQAEVQGYEHYSRSGSATPYPHIRNAFMQVLTSEQENASRLVVLNQLKDYGSQPYVVDIEEVTKENETFRTALWTGKHLQVTLMSIEVGEDIGLEVHPDLDQFIRIEEGQGLVQMGDSRDHLDFQKEAFADFAIMVPAGKWHNLTNTGNTPLKVYSIYAPPEHPFGTVHETKEIAMAAEHHHHH